MGILFLDDPYLVLGLLFVVLAIAKGYASNAGRIVLSDNIRPLETVGKTVGPVPMLT